MCKIYKDYGTDRSEFWILRDNSWGGAIETLDEIAKYDETNVGCKREEFMELIDELFYEPTYETEVNDYIWFERDEIFKLLDIPTEEE